MKRMFLLTVYIFLFSLISIGDEIIPAGQMVDWYPGTVPSLANKDIIIEAGATLNIKPGCFIVLSSGKKILLKKNSKIVIDQSQIGNMNWWKGFVFDNSNLQGTDKPGVVIIKNESLIQGATEVFQAFTYAGGGVIASNSKFENNRRIMIMGPHIYNGGMNSCAFVNCDFYTTMCCHINNDIWFNLSGVKNIRFTGCRFMNHASNEHAITAIRAVNARITIEQSTFMDGNPNRRSVFSGFPAIASNSGYAIEITNMISDQTSKVHISNTDFTSISAHNFNFDVNQKAIYLKGCSNAEIYSNTVDLVGDGSNEKHGIFFENCSGFIVEDNEITATAQSGNPPLFTYGIIIKNSGSQTNEIYRNRLYNTHYGIQAQERNRGAGDFNLPAQGLKFLCNEFNSFNRAYYMSAVNCNNPDPYFGVSKWQQGAIMGASESPCFNNLAPRQLTAGTTYDFYNQHLTSGTWDIQYMLPSGSLGNYAITYFSNSIYPNTDPTTTAQSPHCESRLPCTGPLCPVLANPIPITEYFSNFSTLKTQLFSMVNNGNHSYLLSLVESVDARTLSSVYDALMSSVPSHDILAIACANELFTSSMIRDILVQNSYGIKSLSVREAIAQRDDEFSQQMLDEIYLAAEELSDYESLMYQIDYMNQEYMYVMNRSIDALIGREIVPMDSVKLYLDAIGDILSYIKLIQIAFDEDDIDGAGDLFVLLEQIADDSEELEYYAQLYSNILLNIYSNHQGDFTQMDGSQISFLYDLIETNTYAAAIGKYLLTTNDDYDWIPQYCEVKENSQRKGQEKVKVMPALQQLQFYPNPTTDRLTVEISGREFLYAKLEISDLSGRIVLKESLQAQIEVIDVSLLKPGFYIVRVNISGNMLSKPLIVNN